MREKASQVEYDDYEYGYEKIVGDSEPKKRLDLNDLLKRVKNEKKYEKKINILTFLIAIFAISTTLFIYSLI